METKGKLIDIKQSFQSITTVLTIEFEAVPAKVEELKAVRESRLKRAESLSAFMFEVHEQDRLVEMFNKKLWLATVDTVIVSRDGKLTFKFKNGKEITK